jgi:acyl-CoA synthetase (NDP forming)
VHYLFAYEIDRINTMGTPVTNLIKQALSGGRKNLSEFESKKIISQYGIPIVKEKLVESNIQAVKDAAISIGYPVVIKACSSDITHKTEKGLIEVNLRNEHELLEAFERINALVNGMTFGILVQELIKGDRELVIGLKRDPQFGPCVMFGLGGIFTELFHDVTFRIAPIDKLDAVEMMREINGHKILDAFRNMPPVDSELLVNCLIAVGEIGLDHKNVAEIDLNPIIIQYNQPVAVDALVILRDD